MAGGKKYKLVHLGASEVFPKAGKQDEQAHLFILEGTFSDESVRPPKGWVFANTINAPTPADAFTSSLRTLADKIDAELENRA